jgi:choline dehydrogenase-like flavoprotein
VMCMQPGAPVKATGAKSSVSVAPGGEVVLTAGAIHSPQLLLASGIGPKQQLKSFNIDTVSDLSGVGKNLQVLIP